MTEPNGPGDARDADDVPVSRSARPIGARKFLVAPGAGWRTRAEAYSKRMADLYLPDARLRLREQTDSDTGERRWKLTKKHAAAAGEPEQVVSMFLSESEYEALRTLGGRAQVKTRHYVPHGGSVFSVDVFEGPLAGLTLCEIEAESPEELSAITPPPWASAEVTGEAFFAGGNLCALTSDDLAARLGTPLSPASD